MNAEVKGKLVSSLLPQSEGKRKEARLSWAQVLKESAERNLGTKLQDIECKTYIHFITLHVYFSGSTVISVFGLVQVIDRQDSTRQPVALQVDFILVLSMVYRKINIHRPMILKMIVQDDLHIPSIPPSLIYR